MHATIAFSALPLLLGALLSDWAYSRSYEMQWTNFAAWLSAGGLALAGLALAWAAVDALRPGGPRHRRQMVYLGLLLLGFVLGFINALVHAKDGWAVMPIGMVLSLVVFVLVAIASVIGLLAARRRAP